MSDNVAVITSIYEAFRAGNVDAILARMDDGVAWESWADNSSQTSGVPWMQPRSGKQGVLEFFQYVGANMRVHDVQILSVMSGGNQVAVEFVFEAELASTGGRYRDEEIHLWTLNDAGKVTRLRHYTDTAKHQRAWNHGAAT